MRHDPAMPLRGLRQIALRRAVLAGGCVCVLAVAGCGSSSKSTPSREPTRSAPGLATSTGTPVPSAPPASADLGAAEHPAAREFPAARGRTLKQLAALVKSSATLG